MARWKRGQAAQGVKQAVHYAFGGVCDATLTAKTADGALAAVGYADAVMTRYIVENGAIRDDLLTRSQLKDWVDGVDPLTGERRGRDLESPVADLILDATINAPKSFSIAAMLDSELAAAYEDLQDRLRDRIIKLWQSELNARRGKQGAIREDLARIEVVELQHERSRSLDPHKHRHLWLNVKVQGLDGKWSNVDTRVALRFQNVINAEGDLASRTDPAWIAALAAKGFTMNSDGEIAELQHLVRPLSKRSAQIESNKAAHLLQWKQEHPGDEPSFAVLAQIDQWAWAAGRPNKPRQLNEEDWASIVMAELLRADPKLRQTRSEIVARSAVLDDLDIDLLAAKAVVDADARSTGTGGRFSDMDIRAGAIRALAGTGVRANRAELELIVDRVIKVAERSHTVTLIDAAEIPHHVKHRMATSTAALKTTVALRIDPLSYNGDDRARNEIVAIAALVEPDRELNSDQLAGASSLAGTAGIVCVSGAAGAGKTTMLKVAGAALRQSGRKMIIVAPTKKASSVAGREANSSSSSLHQLLYDYGWRWRVNDAGSVDWIKLSPGDVDADSGVTYRGPIREVSAGDRIVVDEAGMLELEAANALLDVIGRTGAGVALVGDQRQALPVGHSGAMALFWRRSPRRVELTTIHRFRDPEWAQLSLRLREPDSSEDMHAIANELIEKGHVVLTDNDAGAGHAMVDAWFQAKGDGETIALITATHAESQTISEAIQTRRLAAGQVSTRRKFIGQAGQVIGIGDIVQTRRNDSTTGVDNRQSWTVKKITDDGYVVLAAAEDSSDVRRISTSYAADHVHLGYASTVYGVQGETTDRSLVGPGVDAAGLYVGLTRGRQRNDIVLVAPTPSAAHRELVEMMQRQPIEETLEKSRSAARQEFRRAATLHPSATGPAQSSPEPRGRAASIQR
ncbi:AAA family ATPase [Leifsonia sp. C5G2]|uniref:AAA family ATPase n=1 Tax=Leifsonia sp. C5G2 TaxID=2735269 RepID=UPI0032DF9961